MWYTDIDRAKGIIVLAALLIMAATWGVGATAWTQDVGVVSFVGLGSIIISMMLVRSVLPGLVCHLFSVVIGLGWSFWVTSRLLPVDYTWLQRWDNLAARLAYWYGQAIQGGTSYDNLMFLFQMNIIIWGMGYLTMWLLFRSEAVWQAVTPGGLVLLINLYYAPQDITPWFLLYVMLSLMLVIRFNLFKKELVWRVEGIFFKPDISFNFLKAGFIFSVVVLTIAWVAPPVVDAQSLGLFNTVEGTWRSIQGEWNRLYANLNYRERFTADSFGQSLSLGGPRHLTDEMVMEVQVDGIAGYWRAVVYDEYTGQGWRSNDSNTASFGPDDPLPLPQFDARRVVTQTYRIFRDGTTVLYAMSKPIWVDRPTVASFSALSEDDALQTATSWSQEADVKAAEITYIRGLSFLDAGETYQAVSHASWATISQLREANTTYPAWIAERYLQLPPNITRRTRQLAIDITDSYNNPYDKARAIETYLRQNLTYNEGMAEPPNNRERVDYVLFESKEAYCDYYASSMIVMLRSLGIPARFAAGFARGTFNADLGAFEVRNRDAHSWVEVYFPEYGWVEFEPTAAQPTIIRPIGDDDPNRFMPGGIPGEDFPFEELPADRPENIPIDEEAIAPGASQWTWLPPGAGIARPILSGAVLVVVFGGLGLALLAGVWLVWQRSQSPQADATRLYQNMVWFGSWMGIRGQYSQTAYEHGDMLAQALPHHRQDVWLITRAYVHHTFSPDNDAPGTSQTGQVHAAWERLRPSMIRAALRRYLPAWAQRFV